MQRKYDARAIDADGIEATQWEAGADEEEMFSPDEQEALDMAILTIAENILTSREEAIQYRATSGIEQWWRICESLLDYAAELPMTNTMMDYITGNVPIDDGDSHRSRVIMNIVRGRTEVARGRFSDILLPVRDRNWGFKTSPVVETMEFKGSLLPAEDKDGQPIMIGEGEDERQATMDDVYKELEARAKKAMAGMEKLTDDQLNECCYAAQCRLCVESAANLGTGILKGPYVSKKLKKVWKRVPSKKKPGKYIRVLQYKEDTKPVVTSESVWNVFPSPDAGEDIAKSSYIWHMDTIRPKDVAKLIGLPGYNKRQLKMVLQEKPKRLNIVNNQRGNAFSLTMERLNLGNLYETWEYNGEVRPEWLQVLGCDCEDSDTPVTGKVIFINDRPVKASLNLLDTGDLPFHFFAWSTVPDQPWGAGEPLKILWPQRIINAAWRAMMDNAGDSSGVNLAILGLIPDDDVWETTGRKIWKWDGVTPLTDVRQAITQFQAINNQKDLQSILDLALRFIDLMTATPTIFQGEAKDQPETLGQSEIIVDSSNITYREKLARWDDKVTVPLLRQWYDYNMQYHEDDSIKVDLDVDPRGATVLYERDQMQQRMLQVLQLKSDPDINRRTDWDKFVEQFFAANHLDILKDDEPDPVAQEGQPVDPAAAAAQAQEQSTQAAAQIRVEGELKKAELQREIMMEEMRLKKAISESENATKIKLKEMDVQIKMMDFANSRNMNLDDLKVQLAISAKGYEVKAAQPKPEPGKKPGEKNPEPGPAQTSPQVTEEGTEPPGRAPAGEAFPL